MANKTEKKDGKAVVRGKNLRISFKFSVEASNFIRGKTLETAIMHLERVISQKMAMPMKRYKRDQAHKPGKIAAGRYPEKVSKAFINLLNTLRSNAEDLGLSSKGLVITHAVANKGPGRWKQSRMRGRQMKSTHVEIEATEAKAEKKVVKEVKKEETKK
jgi:large subunit ribosomal protein L22